MGLSPPSTAGQARAGGVQLYGTVALRSPGKVCQDQGVEVLQTVRDESGDIICL